MKKYYHMTSLDRVRSISNTGLTPKSVENNKIEKINEEKVNFSEGMTGTVASYADFQKRYDEIKSGNVGDASKDKIDAICTSGNLEEYLGDGVYFLFDGTNIENENSFMNGTTSEVIPPESLKVCLLRNEDTKEVSYSRFDIIKYMMAKVPAETINYFGKDNTDVEAKTTDIRKSVQNYVKKNEKQINIYKFGNYSIEDIPVREFCEKYLSQKESSVTGQSIGKVTMDLLKDVESVRMMENILDRDVRGIELEQEAIKEPDKIREKKENQ